MDKHQLLAKLSLMFKMDNECKLVPQEGEMYKRYIFGRCDEELPIEIKDLLARSTLYVQITEVARRIKQIEQLPKNQTD